MAVVRYSFWVLYHSDEKCGPHKRSSPDGIFQCKELQHIVVDDINEKQLIESRIFKILDNEDVICAYHRQIHGTQWVAPTRCMYPLHQYAFIGPKMKKVKHIRSATTAQYHAINQNPPKQIPNVCKSL